MINGKHWSEEDFDKIKGYSSIIVSLIPSENSRDYPHKTEDCWISEDIHLRHSYNNDLSDLAKDLQDSVSKTIASIFNWKVKKKQYVPAKTKCASLGAVMLPTRNIEFYKDDNSKLRVKIQDTDDNNYDLRVTCKYLRDKFEKTKGVDELNNELQNASKAHLRIGLAKPFVEKDNNCYLMCNGLFCF